MMRPLDIRPTLYDNELRSIIHLSHLTHRERLNYWDLNEEALLFLIREYNRFMREQNNTDTE